MSSSQYTEFDLPYGEAEFSFEPTDYPIYLPHYDAFPAARYRGYVGLSVTVGLVAGVVAGSWSVGKMIWDDRWTSWQEAGKRFIKYGGGAAAFVTVSLVNAQTLKIIRGIPFLYPGEFPTFVINSTLITTGYILFQWARVINNKTAPRWGRIALRGAVYGVLSSLCTYVAETFWFNIHASHYFEYAQVKAQLLASAKVNNAGGSVAKTGSSSANDIGNVAHNYPAPRLTTKPQ